MGRLCTADQFFNAAYFLLNQKMAMKASLFMVYRGGRCFYAAAFAGLFTPVPHWEFYALCTLQGALIAFVDGKFLLRCAGGVPR